MGYHSRQSMFVIDLRVKNIFNPKNTC